MIPGACLRPALWAAIVALAGACGGAPGDGAAADGAPTSDGPADAAAVVDAGAVIDGAPGDATPADATAPDGGAPDGGSPDNPFDIRLTDVTEAWGLLYFGGRTHPDFWGLGAGVVLLDIDADDDLDVFLARIDDPESTRPGGPCELLVNLGGSPPELVPVSGFSDAFAGVTAHGAAAGDYDDDGDVNLFVAIAGPDRLLANDGTGRFTDVTEAAGVAGPDGDKSAGAVFVNVNADGLLDLYVVNYTPLQPPAGAPDNANRLHLNQGDGTFVNVTLLAGDAGGDGASVAALAADLDGDGDLEIYVANDQFAVNGIIGLPDTGLPPDAVLDPVSIDEAGVPLYVDRTHELGTGGPRSSMGVALADLDGDDRDDIYVTDYGPNHHQQWSAADGEFIDHATSYGLRVGVAPIGAPLVSWGARFLDLDRDGLDELMVVNGAISEPIACDSFQQLDVYLRQPADGAAFDDVTAAVGLPDDFTCPPAPDTPLGGRGLVVGDLDGDGDDDLVVSGYVEPYRFYRNDTPATGRHRLRIELRGTVSAPDPVGAVLRVTRLDGRKLRRVLYGGGDTHSQSARVLEVGLDDATGLAAAEVRWPSGLSQRIDDTAGFAIDETLVVVEPEWLGLSARVAGAGDPAPVLRYAPVNAAGEPLGAVAAGRTVLITRADGLAAPVVDHGDGTYTAALPHPGAPRSTRITVTVDGVELTAHPRVAYR